MWVGIRLRAPHAVLLQMRAPHQTREWQAHDHRRAGIAGLFAQAVRCADLRQARYCGLAKVRRAHLLSATALNLVRLGAWWRGEPRSATRVSAFARLKAA
jgi:transposase